MKSLFFYGKAGIEIEVPGGVNCREVRSRKTVAVPDEAAAVNVGVLGPDARRAKQERPLRRCG